jgi:hypothetical protein
MGKDENDIYSTKQQIFQCLCSNRNSSAATEEFVDPLAEIDFDMPK